MRNNVKKKTITPNENAIETISFTFSRRKYRCKLLIYLPAWRRFPQKELLMTIEFWLQFHPPRYFPGKVKQSLITRSSCIYTSNHRYVFFRAGFYPKQVKLHSLTFSTLGSIERLWQYLRKKVKKVKSSD